VTKGRGPKLTGEAPRYRAPVRIDPGPGRGLPCPAFQYPNTEAVSWAPVAITGSLKFAGLSHYGPGRIVPSSRSTPTAKNNQLRRALRDCAALMPHPRADSERSPANSATTRVSAASRSQFRQLTEVARLLLLAPRAANSPAVLQHAILLLSVPRAVLLGDKAHWALPSDTQELGIPPTAPFPLNNILSCQA
jgi:hypothetical protein